MKKNTLLKILVVLIIILISLISFVGIYTKDKNISKNIIPEYLLGMNLSGIRTIKMDVDKTVNKVVYDNEGKETQDGKNEDGTLKEGYTEVEEKVNPDEKINEGNFENSKKIVEKRLEKFGVKEYQIRQDKQDGSITIQIPEDNITEDVLAYITYMGKFEIQDSDTKEVLLNSESIKDANVLYSNTDYGTAVFLQIEFDKEGKNKLKEISNTYIASKDEEGNETTKKVAIKIDDDTLIETHFSETIETGKLQLSIGSSSMQSGQINEYIKQATLISSLISSGEMQIQYGLQQNKYIETINETTILTILGILLLIVTIALIYIIIKYKTKGIMATISFIGFIASLLVVIRYANVIISLEAIVAILAILVLNFSFINYILKKENKMHIDEIMKEAYTKYISVLIPLAIIAVTFTFMNWTPIISIGMIMFWGLVIFAIYNLIFTRTLLLNSNKE